jgi:hypothetical protein
MFGGRKYSMNVGTIIAAACVLAAIITLLPRPAAKKKCSLGYKALCTFAPISTVVLLMTAGIAWLIGALA